MSVGGGTEGGKGVGDGEATAFLYKIFVNL